MNQKDITLNKVRPLYQYLRKQAENKKAIKYMEVAATFVLITIFLFFAIKPTALAISSLLGEIKSKEIATQKMKVRINNIIQAQESFTQAQGKYSVLESGFPSNPNYYQAAVNFSTLAKNSSLKINQLNFNLPNEDNQPKNNTSKIKSFEIIVSTSGEYQASISFIKELLNNRRLIDISSIRFSQPKDNDLTTGSNLINISIDTDIPYSPIEENEKN